MTTLLNSETRRLYSWWWDSHISPKNSKWLQENLTDMDAKVKAMIKLIEEDADSFARRAEMYYKKRPELMKLVEEFYRAYRALAERYDHATVELRQAHRTMAEAFPNDIPYVLADNSPSGSSGPEAEPHTPEMPHPIRALLDPDDLHKDALGVSSTSSHTIQTRGGNSEEFESRLIKSGLKQLNELFGSRDLAPPQLSVAEGRMRKGLSVHEPEKSEQNLKDMLSQISSENQKLKSQAFSESQHPGKTENEVQTLKKVLLEIQAEKEAVHHQYGKSLEKLSHLERELDHAQKDAGGLDERASKAEIEIKILKEALVELESQRDAGLLQYSQSLQRISILKNKLSVAQEEAKELDDRAVTAENENQHLKQELSSLEAEKEAGLLQYKQYLEKISILETKISLAEENARVLNEQIESTETEVKALKKALTKQNEEKEATALQYKHCLEIIAKMESELCHAQEDAKRLNSEVLLGAAKLKSAEEQCLLLERSNQSLQLEASNLVQKISLKDQELSEKHHELEKLQTLMQVEHSRFKQAEATLQALQTIHSQSQEEQIALTLELKNGLHMLKDLENCRHGMEEELQKVKEEKRSLNELNFSSTISINNLQNEVFSLKVMKEKLEEEVALKADQSNTLQQEIYHLKEELEGLNGRYQAIMEQVEAVGLNPECIEPYVKDLQDENSKLKEACKMERDEREALHETLKHMDKLLKENAVMENSLVELSSELAGLREKAKNFQESCQFLHEDRSTLVAEKATLLSQLQIITENMQKLLEKNTLLENSLSGAKVELEGLRAKSKSLEELCQLLSNEKSNLLNERRSLESQLENVEQRLGDLEKRFSRLEEKYSHVEKEKEVTLFQVVELQGSLFVEKQERASYVQSCEARLAGLESQVHIMQEESRLGKKVFEDELDRAVFAQVEIFVLQRFIEDLEERNLSLVIECQKCAEASKVSDKLITELECENLEQQVEAEFLLDEIQKLRMIIHQLFRAIQIDPNNRYAGKIEQEHMTVPDILAGIEDLKDSLLRSKDEKQQLLVENSVVLTLLGQLGLEGAELESEKKSIENEFEVVTEQCAMLEKNNQELVEMNMQLRMEMGKSGQREDVLKEELEILCVKLRNLEVAYGALQDENLLLLEEKKALLQRFSNVNKEKHVLEEENSFILHETVALSNLSVVFESFAIEKSVELESLAEKISSLHMVNNDLKTEVGMLWKKMEMKEAENQHLGESVENLGRELNEAKDLSDLFYNQISIGEDFLRQKATELSEAEQKLKAIENMNDELCRTVEELKMECEESRSIRENVERQVLEVLEDCKIQKKEIASLREENEILESEVETLHKEIEEHRIREENLSSELQEQRDEFQLWEAEAATFYFDLQISSIHEVLLENKVQELAGVCEILEDETAAKSLEMEQMKERVSFLESEIREAKTQLSAYVPVIASLRDDIASLEHNALLHTKLFVAVNPEEKDKEMAIHLHEKTCRELTKEQGTAMPDGIPDLQKIQTRIKAVEKVVVEEMERLATQESIKTNFEEEDVMKKTAEFTLKSTSHQEKDIGKEEMPLGDDLAGGLVPQKTTPEDGTLLKDIQLDRVSDSSFYVRNNRDNGRADDQMLELWEAAEQDDSHHPTVDEKPKQASPPVEGVGCQKIEGKEEKSRGPSSELQVEKELGIDKVEVSTTVGEQNQEGYKGKILERLTSDALKLTSLQATLQNLKKKMETNKRSKRVNEIEYENVKRRLQEVEEAALQLVDLHDNLTKQVEESPSSSNGMPSELEEAGNVCRNSVTEQAQKESEKIGRLQFELQNIEYVLLKLEDGKKNKGKYRFLKSKILLIDFFHSEGRTRARRKKKACFCGCTRPSTNGD